MAKWEEGFYITAMAGSTSGSSLVVMSKGTPYTQQSYKARCLPRPVQRRRWVQQPCVFFVFFPKVCQPMLDTYHPCLIPVLNANMHLHVDSQLHTGGVP